MAHPSRTGRIILISGINGYIASNIGLQLLQKGYKVRGTSRSASAKDQLLSDAFKGYDSQYQHYEVKDITEKGAFDQAVKGVHAIIHTASPVDFSLTTVDEFMGPAVDGNLSILNSAKSAGAQLETFVLTSSIAAVADRWKQPADHHYTEADWNNSSEEVARKEFSGPVAYGASKAAAERALWKWREQNEPAFACAAINPAVVTGPPVSWPATPKKLNETLLPLWRIYSGEAKEMPPQIGNAAYIDVRDIARLHIWAAEHPEQSNGQRYLATNGKAPPQAAADLLRARYPDRDIIVGQPSAGYVPESFWFPDGESTFVANKAYEALGRETFINYQQSILDSVEAFEKRWPGYATNYKQ